MSTQDLEANFNNCYVEEKNSKEWKSLKQLLRYKNFALKMAHTVYSEQLTTYAMLSREGERSGL